METLLNNIPFVDILIALAFVYAITSQLVIGIFEFLISRTGLSKYHRGNFLKDGLTKLLDTGANSYLVHRFYIHPIIVSQTKANNRLPHYISAENFANVLVDVISGYAFDPKFERKSDGQVTLVSSLATVDTKVLFLKGLLLMPESPAKDIIVAIWNQVSGGLPIQQTKTAVDGTLITESIEELIAHFEPNEAFTSAKFQEMINDFRLRLANLYNDHQDRMSGWYKKELRTPLLWISLVIVLILNLDFFKVLAFVQLDKDGRDRLVANALISQKEKVADNQHIDSTITKINNSTQEIVNRKLDSVKALSNKTQPYTDSLTIESFSFKSNQSVGKEIIALDSISKQLIKAKLDSINTNDSIDIVKTYDLMISFGIPLFYNKYTPPCSAYANFKDIELPKAYGNIKSYILRESDLKFLGILKWFLGIIISTIFVSRGAPFWFEIISKLINIRSTGKKPIAK